MGCLKYLIVIFICFCYTSALAQYDTIPQAQVLTKMQELKTGTLKDSVFWSCIGLFDVLEYKFVSLYDYKIYVSNQGIYFALSFKDNTGNIAISGVYFMPHIRKSIPDNAPADVEWVPNEHFCRCTAEVGYAIVKKTATGFTCEGAIPEYDTEDNINIASQDTEARQIFFRKYYKKGLEHSPKLKLIEPEILKYLADK